MGRPSGPIGGSMAGLLVGSIMLKSTGLSSSWPRPFLASWSGPSMPCLLISAAGTSSGQIGNQGTISNFSPVRRPAADFSAARLAHLQAARVCPAPTLAQKTQQTQVQLRQSRAHRQRGCPASRSSLAGRARPRGQHCISAGFAAASAHMSDLSRVSIAGQARQQKPAHRCPKISSCIAGDTSHTRDPRHGGKNLQQER